MQAVVFADQLTSGLGGMQCSMLRAYTLALFRR